MPKMNIPEPLLPFVELQKRFKIAFGGRGGTKSQTFAQIFLMKAQTERAKTLCLRELQNSIADSVHALLVSQITEMGLDGFSYTDTAIRLDGQDMFKFKGMARNPDSVKSMHGFKYAWVEEAQASSEDSIRLLTPTLREAESEIWMSLNPMSSADPVSQRFLQPFMSTLMRQGYYEDDQHYVVWINYMDNPWFPLELEKERAWDYSNLPRAIYNHIWLGHYLDEIEGSIIPVEWFDAAIDAHEVLNIEPVGAKYVSHDPSDNGADAKGLAYRHGCVFLDITEYRINDVNAGCDWATDYAITVDADYFIWDCDGLGVSLRRQVGEALNAKRIDYQEFKGSMGVDHPKRPYDPKAIGGKPKTNKQTFKNKRAQYYWVMRDKFLNTYQAVVQGKYHAPEDLICISSKIKYLDKLRAEVCRLPLKQNDNGLIQMMSKDEMKRLHKIDSPNMADSMMMSFAVESTAIKRRQPQIPSIRGRRMSR